VGFGYAPDDSRREFLMPHDWFQFSMVSLGVLPLILVVLLALVRAGKDDHIDLSVVS
jgi:uncharacterized membrane protein